MMQTLTRVIPTAIFLICGVSCQVEDKYKSRDNQVIKYLDKCSSKVKDMLKSQNNGSSALDKKTCESILSKDVGHEKSLGIVFSEVTVSGNDYSVNIEDSRGMKFSDYTSLSE